MSQSICMHSWKITIDFPTDAMHFFILFIIHLYKMQICILLYLINCMYSDLPLCYINPVIHA